MTDKLKFSTLNNIDFKVIMEAFYKSFDNYFVEFPKDNNLFKDRFTAAKVDYNQSVGVFDNDNLIAFIIHGLKNNTQNELVAFNIATGVVPAYRGLNLVSKMYDFIKPKLIAMGVREIGLEVITENISAINSYLKCGFKLSKYYKCFSGKISFVGSSIVEMKKVSKETFDWSKTEQNIYSWENQQECIKNSAFDYYTLYQGDVLNAYLIINPSNGYIPQCDVSGDIDECWASIFYTISNITRQCKINNVDSHLTKKVKHLQDAGLTNHLNQFEMKMII